MPDLIRNPDIKEERSTRTFFFYVWIPAFAGMTGAEALAVLTAVVNIAIIY